MLFAVAVICTEVTELTCLGMILKLTDFVPVDTVTLVGIDTFELLLFSCTVVGLWAVPVSVTIPVPQLGTTIELGFITRVCNVAAGCVVADPVVFRKISVPPVPLTSRARSGLVSPLKSAAIR